MMFGFGLKFVLLLWMPFVGPIAWDISQAVFVALILETESSKGGVSS